MLGRSASCLQCRCWRMCVSCFSCGIGGSGGCDGEECLDECGVEAGRRKEDVERGKRGREESPMVMYQSRVPLPHLTYLRDGVRGTFSYAYQPQLDAPLQSAVTNNF
ncbi:hypothetical protein DsansV1_C27g0196911 [Dioscorea sansibarensis]